MSVRSDRDEYQGARGSPAPFRQEDIERLAAGEMPDELVTMILESGQAPDRAAPVTAGEKLAPVELTSKEIDTLVRGGSTSEELAERLEVAAKLDTNRKRAAGTRAERPDLTPPGEKRAKR